MSELHNCIVIQPAVVAHINPILSRIFDHSFYDQKVHNWFYDSLCQSATRNPSGDKCTFYWDIQINSEILVVISIVRSSTWHIFKLVTRLCTSAFLFKSLYEFRLRRRQYARCATEPPSRSGAGLNTINQHAQWTKNVSLRA